MADRTSLLREVPAPRPEPADEQTPLAWWHLRGWRVDRRVLSRVRVGLQALAPRPETVAAPLADAPAQDKPAPAAAPAPAPRPPPPRLPPPRLPRN